MHSWSLVIILGGKGCTTRHYSSTNSQPQQGTQQPPPYSTMPHSHIFYAKGPLACSSHQQAEAPSLISSPPIHNMWLLLPFARRSGTQIYSKHMNTFLPISNCPVLWIPKNDRGTQIKWQQLLLLLNGFLSDVYLWDSTALPLLRALLSSHIQVY